MNILDFFEDFDAFEDALATAGDNAKTDDDVKFVEQIWNIYDWYKDVGLSENSYKRLITLVKGLKDESRRTSV